MSNKITDNVKPTIVGIDEAGRKPKAICKCIKCHTIFTARDMEFKYHKGIFCASETRMLHTIIDSQLNNTKEYNKYRTTMRNRKAMTLHRVIYEFCYGVKLGYDDVIHHIDGNNFNNDILNLELLSRSEHGSQHNTGSKNKAAKLNKEKVLLIRQMYKGGTSLDIIARIFKMNANHIMNVITGKYWRHVQLY